MLTVDFDRLRVGRGTRFIDVGAGAGRHSYEALRRGAMRIGYQRQLRADARGVAHLREAFRRLFADAGFGADDLDMDTLRRHTLALLDGGLGLG